MGSALRRTTATDDRLRVPQSSIPLLDRPRVTALIEQAVTHRVSAVCGPTGAGKTIACAMWASGRQARGASRARAVGWLSLDPTDHDPSRLWTDVAGALAATQAFPDGLLRELPAPADEAFPLRLARAAQQLPDPVTLILDDIQELTGSQAHSSLDQLIRHGPAQLRLLLSGRHLAGLQVARLRVAGDLGEIGQAELACTADEAERYLAMLGVELSGAHRDHLLSRTQGWIAGLRLAAMRVVPGKPSTAAWRISGEEPAVADYLLDEVLGSQSTPRRRFLLKTSVTDEICGDLADALTASSGGAATLDQLCRENVLIGPAGDDGDKAAGRDGVQPTYSYHPLLRDLLRSELHRERPDEVRILARRAARWQAGHAMPAEAIRNAAVAGDWDFAAHVLAQIGPAMLLPGPAAKLEPVLRMFPASRCTGDAAVACTLAAAGIRTGDVYAAALHLDNAEQALARCSAYVRRLITPWLRALRLMNTTELRAADSGLVAESAAIAEQAEATATTAAEHDAIGLLWTALGVAALTKAAVTSAREALARACGHLQHGSFPEFDARARGWLALAEAMHGDLRASGELAATCTGSGTGPSVHRDFLPDGSDAADPLALLLADLASAYAHLARDDAGAARRLLDRCESTANGPPTAKPLIGSLISMARARLALGDSDPATARALVTRLRYQICAGENGSRRHHAAAPEAAVHDAPGAHPLTTSLAVLDTDIALREGDVNRARLALAPTLASRLERSTDPPDQRNRTDVQLAHARVLLAMADGQGALATLAPCLNGAAAQMTVHEQITALVTAAIAHRRLGANEPAADELAVALALAEPDGIYRPFLDGGPAVRSALTALIRPPGNGATLAARVLQRFESFLGRTADQPAAAPIALTSSELAVLRFLPSHMTNQEIAEALFLSINTIKTHLRSVYRKLGVRTRRQAIARGDRLGLL